MVTKEAAEILIILITIIWIFIPFQKEDDK